MLKHARVDKKIQDRLDAARKQRLQHEKTWAIADAFYHGRQNVQWSAIDNGRIVEYPRRQRTSSGEIVYRQTRNRIRPAIKSLVAKYNAKMPAWAVDPESGDPVAIANARSSEHALSAVYGDLNLSRKFAKLLTLAANQGEAYAYVYWDAKAGRPIGKKGSDTVYEGAAALRVLPPQAVLWEAGLDFDESPWHAIELAFPASYVETHYGVKNPSPDAVHNGSLIDNHLAHNNAQANMVTVVEYLERPCAGHEGSRQIIIGDRAVEQGGYSYGGDEFAEVSDQPWLVRYSYDVSPSGERDLGVTQDLIDLQNAYNVTVNQLARYKDLVVNPPLVALKNSYKGPSAKLPGHLYEYTDPEGKPEWDMPPDPGAAPEAYLQRLDRDFEVITGNNDVSAGRAPENVETASGIQALIMQDDSQRATTANTLAQSHSAVGLRFLLLLRRYYDTRRLMRFTGKAGVEGAMMFQGSQVPKRLAVKVNPASLQARSRSEVERLVYGYAQMGWIDPRTAMTAIEAGTADNILDQFDLDIQWQQREDRRMAQMAEGDLEPLMAALEEDAEIRAQYEAAKQRAQQMMMQGAPVELPQPPLPTGPWPHAREFDNHKIHMDTMNLYRKTEEFDLLPEPVKQVFQRHYEEHETFQAEAEQRAFEAQQRQAMEQGEANAAKPARVRGVPSAPAPSLN